MQKYSVNQYIVNNILNWAQTGAIAIPEIQRPFVWSSSKVRDLMDSLYNGYPIGYIIAWKNPNVRLKDGSRAEGRKVLIDGQQRVISLKAAVLGEKIITKDYQEKHIHISFHPIEEKFETLTPAIEKDPRWIPVISEILKSHGNLFSAVEDYCSKNPEVPKDLVQRSLTKLDQIKNCQVGFIELEADLDIEVVTEIFVRINSQGVTLGQADFAMSKIASYDEKGRFGPHLRKAIDYFCHLAKAPHFYECLEEKDPEFSKTNYFPKMRWLKNENDDLYDPDYSDVLRVALTKEFERGRMRDLVSLLSGRNFETRDFEQEIMDESFERLSSAVYDLINETHFKRFVMILKSAGFIDKGMISSQNVLNMAYAIYLKLRDLKIENNDIEKYVQKWLLMSILTGRYSGSPESQIDTDIKNIVLKGIDNYLGAIEEAQLSDAFWNVELVQELDKSTITSPHLQVFFASQVKNNTLGFLSKDITVRDLISHRGDVHHVFPKAFLKKKYPNRRDYNQVANYVFAQSEINIKIGNKSPDVYFQEILEQCKEGKTEYGNITSQNELMQNLTDHAIPHSIFDQGIENYPEFLEQRRRLMARKIKDYYHSLSGVNDDSLAQTNHLKVIGNGETDIVEFKEGLGWNKEQPNDYNLEKATAKVTASFLNSKGGQLYLGVKDNKDIVGVGDDIYQSRGKNIDGFLTRLTTAIQKYLGKTINQYIKIEMLTLEGKSVCLINVLPSANPVYLKDGNIKGFYVRSSATSHPLDVEEANSYIASHWS